MARTAGRHRSKGGVAGVVVFILALAWSGLAFGDERPDDGEVCEAAQADPAASVAACTRILDNPDSSSRRRSQAYYNRGLANDTAGDAERAIEDYSEALALDPGHAGAYNNRGTLKGDKGDFDGAIDDYTQAMAYAPDDPLAYYNRGITFGEKGDDDAAIADYSQAITLNPAYASAYFNRAGTRSHKRDFAGAIEDYDEYLLLDPDGVAGYYFRAENKNEKGDIKGAIADYDQVLARNPTYLDTFAARGRARYYHGNPEGALADFKDAFLQAPDSVYAAVWLELGLRKLGQPGRLAGLRDRLKTTDWTDMLLTYVLGEASYDETLAFAMQSAEDRRASRACQLFFYAGELNRLADEPGRAVLLYEQAVQRCPKDNMRERLAGRDGMRSLGYN